jgi:hypothetical protein
MELMGILSISQKQWDRLIVRMLDFSKDAPKSASSVATIFWKLR